LANSAPSVEDSESFRVDLALDAHGPHLDKLLSLLDRTEAKIRTMRFAWISIMVCCGTVLLFLGALAPVSSQVAPYVMSCYWIFCYASNLLAVRENIRARHGRVSSAPAE
jgi:hypothetical protein